MSEIRIIHDVEELRSLEHKEQFQFTCEKCGKTCTVKRALSVNNQIKDYHKFGGLICTSCKFQAAYPREQAAEKHKAWHSTQTDEQKAKRIAKQVATYNNKTTEEKLERSKRLSVAQRNLSPEKKQAKLVKFRNTNQTRYGTDGRPPCAIGSEAFKNRMLDIHGVEKVSDIPGMTRHIIEQAAINAGYTGDLSEIKSIMDIPSVREKTENTNLEKIGVKYPFQSADIQELGAVRREEKYGDRNYSNREQADKTFRANHDGMSFAEYGGSDECQKLIKQTKLENHGDPNWNNPEKNKETCLAHFGKATYFGTDECKQQKITKCLERYGSVCPNFKYDYYGIRFDSAWELAVWIYCINFGIPIIRCVATFKYKDRNGKEHDYIPDFMINGKYIEIKGDHFFKSDGTMYYPFNTKNVDGKRVDLDPEEKAFMDDLYERKHQCGLSHGVEFWRESDCQKYLDYCDIMYPGWRRLFRKENPFNPTNMCFAYILNAAKWYTPYDIDLSKEYTEPVGKGMTPFDLGLCIKSKENKN